MALRFMDGFEFFTAIGEASGQRWDVGSGGQQVGGRYGSIAWSVGWSGSAGISQTLGAQPMWVTGFAAYTDEAFSEEPWFAFRATDPHAVHVIGVPTPLISQFALWFGTAGMVMCETFDGTGLSLGQEPTGFVMPVGLWLYFEVKTSATATEVRVDGDVVWTGSPLLVPASQLFWGSPARFNGGHLTLDDLYICDGTGDAFNDYLGDLRIVPSVPHTTGAATDFLPAFGDTTAANRVSMVNGRTTNYTENGRYNYDGRVADKDLYIANPYSAQLTPIAVQVHTTHAKDSVDLRAAAPLLRTNGVVVPGPAQACYTYYRTMTLLAPINPVTGLPWVMADVNNIQIGIQIAS